MSVMDAFYFLFESDARKLDKGLKDSEHTSDELEKSLMSTDAVADKLGGSFLELAKNAGTALVGMLAYQGIKAMTTASAEATNQIGDLANKARVSTETFSALQSQLLQTGKDTGALGGELEGLAKRFRDPEQALGRIADRMKGMSTNRANNLGEQFGLGPDTVTLLMKGKQGLDDIIARNKQLGVVSREQVEVAQKFRSQQAMTGQVWEGIQRMIATAVLPAFTWAMEAMQKFGTWIKDNRTFVVGFFGAVAAMITAFYLPALARAVAATYAMLAPYLAVAAVVAALGAVFALVIDDVLAFLDGQNSVIGELSKKWPWVGEAVKDVAQIVKGFWEYLKLFAAFWTDVFTEGPRKAFKNLGDGVEGLVNLIGERFPKVKEYADQVVKAFVWMSDVTGITFDDIANAASLWLDGMMTMFNFVADMLVNGPAKAFSNLRENVVAMLATMGQMFPQAGAVVSTVAKGMTDAADTVAAAWGKLMAVIGKVVDFVGAAVGKVASGAAAIKSKLGFGDDESAPKEGSAPAAPAQRVVNGDVPLMDDQAEPAPGARASASTTPGQQGERGSLGMPTGQASPAAPVVNVQAPSVQPVFQMPQAPQMPPATAQAVQQGQTQVAQSNREPLAAQTSNAISNTNNSRSTTNHYKQEVGEVNVHTQSTDPDAISKTVGTTLGDQMRQAIDQNDDGVAA